MLRKTTVLLIVFFGIGGLFAADPGPDDFSVWLEPVGDPATTDTVLVVGSWDVSEVQGWQMSVCNDDDGTGHFGDTVDGEPCDQPNPEDMDDHAIDPPCDGCPQIVCTDDFKNAGGAGVTFGIHLLNVYTGGYTQAVVPDVMMTWTLDATTRFEMMEITYSNVNPATGINVWVCGDPDGPDDIPDYKMIRGRRDQLLKEDHKKGHFSKAPFWKKHRSD